MVSTDINEIIYSSRLSFSYHNFVFFPTFLQIRAAHSLLSLSHSLKLLHLFADTATTSAVREGVSSRLEKEIEEAKEVLKGIVEGRNSEPSISDVEMNV